jgi:hypothetical protein
LGGLGVQACLGLAQPLEAVTGPGQLRGESVAAGQLVFAILALVGLAGLLEHALDLGLDPGLELLAGPIAFGGGVGGQLGAVQGHGAQADQPGRGTQAQGLDQQPGQGLLVADPETGQRHMVGSGVGGQDAEGDVLVAAPFDLAGGTNPGAVGVQQHGQQHLGVVGGPAVPVRPIGAEERGQVQLVDHVEHEPGQMICRQPVPEVGWEQECLVTAAGKKVVGHG